MSIISGLFIFLIFPAILLWIAHLMTHLIVIIIDKIDLSIRREAHLAGLAAQKEALADFDRRYKLTRKRAEETTHMANATARYCKKVKFRCDACETVTFAAPIVHSSLVTMDNAKSFTVICVCSDCGKSHSVIIEIESKDRIPSDYVIFPNAQPPEPNE